MKVKRDWLYTVTLVLYEMIIFLAMANTFRHLGADRVYPNVIRAQWLICVALMLGGAVLFGCLWGRLEAASRLQKKHLLWTGLEWTFGLALIAAGLALRIRYTALIEYTPEGDGLVYYDIARLLSLGSLTMISPYYCNYVSLLPSLMGYPRLLSMAFSVAGISVSAAQALNLTLQGLALLIVWRLARKLAGRIGGLAALTALAFWPSMILFSGEIASEFLTVPLLFLAFYLIVSQEVYPLDQKRPFRHVFLLLLAGVCLGLAAGSYALILIPLLALAIYMRRQRHVLPAKISNDLPLGHRMISRGWAGFLLLLLSFLFTFWVVRLTTGYLTERSPVGPVTSLGYSMMQGLNQDSEGAWNQEDANFLMEKLEETGSATETQLRCYDIARLRLSMPAESLVSLMMSKMDNLLGNDEYASSDAMRYLFAAEEAHAEGTSFFRKLAGWSDFYYMILLLLAGIGGAMCYSRRQSFAYALMLIFVLTVLAHLLLDCLNRYHYVLLPILCVMSGMAVREIMTVCAERIMRRKQEQLREKQEKAQRAQAIEDEEQRMHELIDMRAKALHAQFDMSSALKEGHVRMILSQAVAEQAVRDAAAEQAPQDTAASGNASTPEGGAAPHE